MLYRIASPWRILTLQQRVCYSQVISLYIIEKTLEIYISNRYTKYNIFLIIFTVEGCYKQHNNVLINSKWTSPLKIKIYMMLFS